MRLTAFPSLFVLLLAASPLACKPDPGPTETPGTEQPPDDPGQGDPVACGGLAGTPCADGLTCVDDPADDCDPTQGGRDCLGMCVEASACDHGADPAKTYVGKSPEACQTIRFICEENREYFADECGCGCALTSG